MREGGNGGYGEACEKGALKPPVKKSDRSRRHEVSASTVTLADTIELPVPDLPEYLPPDMRVRCTPGLCRYDSHLVPPSIMRHDLGRVDKGQLVLDLLSTSVSLFGMNPVANLLTISPQMAQGLEIGSNVGSTAAT